MLRLRGFGCASLGLCEHSRVLFEIRQPHDIPVLKPKSTCSAQRWAVLSQSLIGARYLGPGPLSSSISNSAPHGCGRMIPQGNILFRNAVSGRFVTDKTRTLLRAKQPDLSHFVCRVAIDLSRSTVKPWHETKLVNHCPDAVLPTVSLSTFPAREQERPALFAPSTTAKTTRDGCARGVLANVGLRSPDGLGEFSRHGHRSSAELHNAHS